MLVLTRKPNESIDILGVGKITVVAMKGNAVRIGLEFPEQFKIFRTELVSEFHDSSGDAVPAEHQAIH